MKARLAIKDLTFGSNGPYDLDCFPGCLGIRGESGTGKTLFLRAIADLDRHRGTVTLNDRECREFQAPEWRQRVAMVPAESRWWYRTVGEHIPDDADDTHYRNLLGSLGFEEDVLSWRVGRLSTGEKQRLALIRALAREPSVLLLDEAGSALDFVNTLLLEDVVKAYSDGRDAPVLWVSHDREQIERVSNRMVTLYRDRLEENVIVSGSSSKR